MTAQTLIKLMADGAVIPIVILAGYALLFKVPSERRFEVYGQIIMAGLTSYLIAKLIGAIYQPTGERPFEVLGTVPGASYLKNAGFPSDHALFATFLTLAVWFGTRQRLLSISLAILTVAVCVGRVLALVHTPLDIIGGIVVACVGSLWYFQVKKYQPEQPLAKITKI